MKPDPVEVQGKNEEAERHSRIREAFGISSLGSKEGSYNIDLQIVMLRRKRQLGSCFNMV